MMFSVHIEVDTVVNRGENFFETVYMILLNLCLEELKQSDITYILGLSRDELKRYFVFFLKKGLFRVTEGGLFIERFEVVYVESGVNKFNKSR